MAGSGQNSSGDEDENMNESGQEGVGSELKSSVFPNPNNGNFTIEIPVE